MLAVPFSVVGAVWLMYILGYNISIAAWVGMIALMGLDAETGVFMLLFLDLSYDEAKREGRLGTLAELNEAIIHGAVKRVRPKMMTVTAALMGLMPIMWSVGTGADVMKRVAAPMVGGLATLLPHGTARLSRDLPALEMEHRGQGTSILRSFIRQPGVTGSDLGQPRSLLSSTSETRPPRLVVHRPRGGAWGDRPVRQPRLGSARSTCDAGGGGARRRRRDPDERG